MVGSEKGTRSLQESHFRQGGWLGMVLCFWNENIFRGQCECVLLEEMLLIFPP